jgi:hypothetical protein
LSIRWDHIRNVCLDISVEAECYLVKENSMNKKIIILLIILAIVSLFSTVTAVFSVLQRNATNRLLNKLTLAKPGIHISEISQQLGTQMRELSELDEVVSWGSVKDKSFCKDKKLYWFYVSTPPCRVLEIYTDTNDYIVYVTWSGL